MLDQKCFTRQWIERHSKDMKCRNNVLLEKAILALQLIGHLVETGLPFQFKGGTSLLLLVQPIRRLSIDADIVTQATPQQFDKALATVSRLASFTRIEHDPRRDKDLPPKKHYRVFYTSAISSSDDHVLLDVLFESVSDGEPLRIATPFIETTRDVLVTVPSVNALLGDKLTAFAPETIGILYNAERSADIVKQLFDISVLFDMATDLAVAAATYTKIHANQCRYRQKLFTPDQTLDDTIEACVALSQHGLKGVPKENTRGSFFLDGIARLQSHLVTGPFSQDRFRVAAGKTACAAAWLKRRAEDVAIQSLRYNPARLEELRSAAIGPPWQPLHRLRGGNQEAFFYWWRTQQLLVDGQ